MSGAELIRGSTSNTVTIAVPAGVCPPPSAATVQLTGNAYCRSGTPAVSLSFNVSGGTPSTFDLYRNGGLLYPANTGTPFHNYPVMKGTSYTYYVVVRLTTGSTVTSNQVAIPIPSSICP